MSAVPNEIHDRLARWPAPVAPSSAARLAHYLELLFATNERFNLTSVIEPDAAWERHVLDSLTLLPRLDALLGPDDDVVDLGSGGGLPGIPLAICRPETRFLLVEATQKKARFLEDCAAALDLRNVRIAPERAEDLAATPAHRERHGFVACRAVARLPTLLEYALPLLRRGGRLLALKGEQADEEVARSGRALRELGGSDARLIRLDALLPGRAACIVEVEKVRPTPAKYPRGSGAPTRKPLLD